MLMVHVGKHRATLGAIGEYLRASRAVCIKHTHA